MWSKLKKSLSFKITTTSSAAARESSPIPPRVPEQSESRSSTASLSSRFSRSLSLTTLSSKKTCAICLGNVRIGQGQAIFTAECSHAFHFSCIANSVKHGNHRCPVCRSKWKEIPFQLPTTNADFNIPARVSPYEAPSEPVCFSDDEPLLVVPTNSFPCFSPAPANNNVSIKAFPEFPAIAARDSVSDFAVLVSVRGPPLSVERAPIDLVTVLDVSGSMNGSKLFLLQRAVCFVIDNLGPADRLSIVSFAVSSNRIFPLRRMTDRGREDAKRAVNSLYALGGTDIVEGLKKGARVLEERREKNPVASIILLSDGRDTSNRTSTTLGYLNHLPPSIRPNSRQPQREAHTPSFPVHTFGFGLDHDSSAMHAISDASRGTFSFIESVDMVQDGFARCIGGLLSVVAQEVRLDVTSASPGVEIGSIPSGRYGSEIFPRGLHGMINVGDLYADEEKEFLVYLSVPVCPIAEGEDVVEKRTLLNIACSYIDPSTKAVVELEGERVVITRPKIVSPADATMSVEVDRQRNRLLVAASIAEAQKMAERGNLEDAQAVLASRRLALLTSPSAQAGDALCSWLEAELLEIRNRLVNMEMYEHTGRAYMLSGLSSHSWQRSTTRGYSTTFVREVGSSTNTAPVGYDTPSMVGMVTKSQNLTEVFNREQVGRKSKSTTLTIR